MLLAAYNGGMTAIKILFVGLALLLAGLAAAFLRFDLSKEELAAYWRPPSQFMELPGGANVHYRDQGNQDAPALVLVHGGLASLHTWEKWAAALGDDFRIISADLPAHGLTGPVPGDVYTRESMVAFLDELLSALEVERFVLAGNSMGGGVAALYAMTHPQKVAGLILLAPGGVNPGEDDTGREAVMIGKTTLPGQSGGLADEPLSWKEKLMLNVWNNWLVKKGLQSVVADKSIADDAMAKRYGDMIRSRGNRRAQLLLYRQYYANAGAEDLLPRVSEIQAPTLLLWGDQDTLVPREAMQKYSDALADGEWTVYENVGHIPMEEIPERSADDIRRFIQNKARF